MSNLTAEIAAALNGMEYGADLPAEVVAQAWQQGERDRAEYDKPEEAHQP